MKYLFLTLLFLSGRAVTSDYRKGCEDALDYVIPNPKVGLDERELVRDWKEKVCKELDSEHIHRKMIENPKNR